MEGQTKVAHRKLEGNLIRHTDIVRAHYKGVAEEGRACVTRTHESTCVGAFTSHWCVDLQISSRCARQLPGTFPGAPSNIHSPPTHDSAIHEAAYIITSIIIQQPQLLKNVIYFHVSHIHSLISDGCSLELHRSAVKTTLESGMHSMWNLCHFLLKLSFLRLSYHARYLLMNALFTKP